MQKILVVDDSMLARKILIKSLPKGWEVEVSQTDNGAAAVAACRAAPPSLMFLDLNMPDMDGYQVLAELTAAGLPPTIVLSGDIQPVAQERVLAMGAKAFLKKPANPAEIEAALRNCGLL